MAIVSRLQLDHPALGATGGAGLHASIEAIYSKIGNNMADRILVAVNLNNAATATVTHNFKTPFANLRYDLYLYDETTTELDLITSSSTPPISQFTIMANGGNPETQIDILNSSGVQRDLALVVFCDPINLRELADLNVTSPQDGQALVFNSTTSKWEAGASGDASFKFQSIAANVLSVKGGFVKLGDGREIATYNGSTYGSDITVNLASLFAAPLNGTAYYLYVDLNSLAGEFADTNSRLVWPVQTADYKLFATKPQDIDRSRYVPLGQVRGTTGSNYSTTLFSTFAAKNHNNGPLTISPKVYSLSQAVGSVGSASQIQAGHLLASQSFPSAIALTQYSFHPLAANALDGNTTNAKNLTNNGTILFTGANIFGGASLAAVLNGTTQNFSSTDAFFNPGASKPFALGGWFRATSWTGSAQIPMAQEASTSDRGFGIIIDGTGLIAFRGANNATTPTDISIPNPGFAANSWHHLAMVYDFGTTTLKGYIDGKLVGTVPLSNQVAVSAPIFRIGARNTAAANFFAGSVEDCFFVNNYLLTDEDIRKIYSTKINHNTNVASANQDWKVIVGSGACKVPNIQPIVCQNNSNTVYVDFSDLTSTETVDLALLDMGMTAVSVPAVPPFDQTYSSNPTFPLSHGLSEVPSLQVGYNDGTGAWSWSTGEGLITANSTQINGTVATLFTAGATQVRIRAIVGASPTGVKQATATAAGIVKGGTVPGATDGAAIAAGFIGHVQTFTGTVFNTTTSTPVVFRTFPGIVKGVYLFTCALTAFAGGNSNVEFRFRKTTGSVLVKNLHAFLPASAVVINLAFPLIVEADQSYELTVHSSNASFQITIEGNLVNQTGTVDAGQTYEFTRIG